MYLDSMSVLWSSPPCRRAGRPDEFSHAGHLLLSLFFFLAGLRFLDVVPACACMVVPILQATSSILHGYLDRSMFCDASFDRHIAS